MQQYQKILLFLLVPGFFFKIKVVDLTNIFFQFDIKEMQNTIVCNKFRQKQNCKYKIRITDPDLNHPEE